MKLKKTMIGGKYLKVNGKHIVSIGHFAFDGCHKIYILESMKDVKMAMEYGYYLYPIEEIRETFENSCPLRFIENFSLNKYYVRQDCEKVEWSEEDAPKKDIDEIVNSI